MTPDDVRAASRSPWWKRLGWFVALWIASVVVVTAVAYALRLAIVG
ncbi:DUF2474 family protein [Jiella sp. M17.18]